jgi:hypothetical protein
MARGRTMGLFEGTGEGEDPVLKLAIAYRDMGPIGRKQVSDIIISRIEPLFDHPFDQGFRDAMDGSIRSAFSNYLREAREAGRSVPPETRRRNPGLDLILDLVHPARRRR